MKKEDSDFYEIFQVNPKADQEVIERVYRLLAKRHHPDNQDAGDVIQFEMLAEAYRTLSDPKKRAAYDQCRAARGHQNETIFNASQSRSIKREKRIYQAILLILYSARREDPMRPGVGIVDLGKLLRFPDKEMEFHIWYLKEKGWVQREETGAFAITVTGVDEVIENDLYLKEDYFLPCLDESTLERQTSGKP